MLIKSFEVQQKFKSSAVQLRVSSRQRAKQRREACLPLETQKIGIYVFNLESMIPESHGLIRPGQGIHGHSFFFAEQIVSFNIKVGPSFLIKNFKASTRRPSIPGSPFAAKQPHRQRETKFRSLYCQYPAAIAKGSMPRGIGANRVTIQFVISID